MFFAPRFLYPFHTSKGGIFVPLDRLLYFLEGRRVDQIEYDDLIAACLHCGTAAAEGGNRIAQRLTLEGIVQLFHRVEHLQGHVAHLFRGEFDLATGRKEGCTNSSAVLMEGFLSKKEKAAKADNRLIMKFGKQRWRVCST